MFPSLLRAWIVGGNYAQPGAISISELAASLPQAGGWCVDARRAFGDYAGVTVGWMDWLASSAILAWILIIVEVLLVVSGSFVTTLGMSTRWFSTWLLLHSEGLPTY